MVWQGDVPFVELNKFSQDTLITEEEPQTNEGKFKNYYVFFNTHT